MTPEDIQTKGKQKSENFVILLNDTRSMIFSALFSSFNFTIVLKVVQITAMVNHIFISFSAAQTYEISYICIHLLRVYPSWLDSSVGRALRRYRRGHGFESRSGTNYFTTAKVVWHNCDAGSIISS